MRKTDLTVFFRFVKFYVTLNPIWFENKDGPKTELPTSLYTIDVSFHRVKMFYMNHEVFTLNLTYCKWKTWVTLQKMAVKSKWLWLMYHLFHSRSYPVIENWTDWSRPFSISRIHPVLMGGEGNLKKKKDRRWWLF